MDTRISYGILRDIFRRPQSRVGRLVSIGGYCIIAGAEIGEKSQIGSHVLKSRSSSRKFLSLSIDHTSSLKRRMKAVHGGPKSQRGEIVCTILFTRLVLSSAIQLVVLLAVVIGAVASDLKIKSNPQAIPAGGCIDFSATAPGRWSVACTGAGCQAGTIDALTGHYCAPTVVRAKNQSRGCQLLPNDDVYNQPVKDMPVDPRSVYWLERVADDHPSIPSYHTFKLGPEGFHDVAISESTPQQRMYFVYGGPWQGSLFPHVQPPDVWMQNGWSQDVAAGLDRHLFQIDKQTCIDYELYNDYFDYSDVKITSGNPTEIAFTTHTIRTMQNPIRIYLRGATKDWLQINGTFMAQVVQESPGKGGVLSIPFDSTLLGKPSGDIKLASGGNFCNGQPLCNSGSGAKWSPDSNALLNGTDAAGSPISATSVHAQEWWNVTRRQLLDPACKCVTLGHAIRTTLSNFYISPRDLWPSLSGKAVTWGHPNMQLLSATRGPVTTFTISNNSCGGRSFLTCQLPCPKYSFDIGCKFHIVIGNQSPYQGEWASANGNWIATAVSDHSFSIPLDSSNFPNLPVGGTFIFDWLPYGSRIVLRPSFDVEHFCSENSLTDKCPYEKVILNTLQVYGMLVLDGTIPSANWESGYEQMEFFPDQLQDAMGDLRSSPKLGHKNGGVEQFLQVVDESSLQVSRDPEQLGRTNRGSITVTVTATDRRSASIVLSVLGTTVGVQPERIAIPAKMDYQIQSWLHGNVNQGLSFNMTPAVPGASVSRTGLITAPASLKELTQTNVQICSVADKDACAYLDVFLVPTAADGTIRLAFGQHATSYTDSEGSVWWGQVTARPFNSTYEIGDGINFTYLNGTWATGSAAWAQTKDAHLYAESTSSNNDTNLTIALPNGNYILTLYGEAGLGNDGPGKNVFDVEINGTVRASYQDGYLLAGGPHRGYKQDYKVQVSDGVLRFNGRIRARSRNGMSWSALQIRPDRGH